MRTIKRTLLGIAIVGALGYLSSPSTAKEKPLSWKPIDDSLLRVNDAPVKDWNVYQAGKKGDPLLVQIGNRFLLMEVHGQRIFEIDPAKITRKSDDLLWNPVDRPAQPLATSAWVMEDLGAAFRIGVKLDADGRVLNLELPHALDIGVLPQTTPNRRRAP